MTRPATDAERADWLDLAQRIRFVYGVTLQDRLIEMGQDIASWWWVRDSMAAAPTPALASAGASHASVAADGSRRSGPPAAAATVAEPKQHGEGGFNSLPRPVREVIAAVADERRVPIDKIMGWQKLGAYADARQECYRRLRKMPWRGSVPSLVQIGIWLHRDHTTVLHGLQKEEKTDGKTPPPP